MSAAKDFIDAHRYEGVEALIDELPQLWIPTLTRRLVERGYSKNVWVKGGCSAFVAKIELMIDTPLGGKAGR